jgi:hypothetical protein
MENAIKITKDLKFDYRDLMGQVDTSHEFTLRDIMAICMNSRIPLKILMQLLRCPYVLDYYEEAESKPFENDGDVEYLELYWWGTKHTYDCVREDSSTWGFHGIGRKGYIPEDILKYCKLTKGEKKNFRQNMAIEFTPMYALADLPIRVCKKMHITDYYSDPKKDVDSGIDFQPSITLMELLYAIFYELSFCGSPKQRDEKAEGLNKQVAKLDKAAKEGRLDEVTIPWKQVKKNLVKKIKNIKCIFPPL